MSENCSGAAGSLTQCKCRLTQDQLKEVNPGMNLLALFAFICTNPDCKHPYGNHPSAAIAAVAAATASAAYSSSSSSSSGHTTRVGAVADVERWSAGSEQPPVFSVRLTNTSAATATSATPLSPPSSAVLSSSASTSPPPLIHRSPLKYIGGTSRGRPLLGQSGMRKLKLCYSADSNTIDSFDIPEMEEMEELLTP